MRSSATSSSSAAICAIAVTMPCPISTLPERMVTAVGVEPDPAVEARVRLEVRGKRGALTCAGASRNAAAARRIARRMRTCVPQRHRLRSSAAAISASLGSRFFREQRLRRHHDAVDAVAALRRLLVEERLLQRMRALGRAQPLDRRDRAARRRPERRVARLDGVAVHEHGARAAVAAAAAEARALERRGRCAGRRRAACSAPPTTSRSAPFTLSVKVSLTA